MYSNFKIIASVILTLVIFNQIYSKKKEDFFITDWLHTESSKTWIIIFLVISILFIIGGILIAINSSGDPGIMHNSVFFFSIGVIYTMFLSAYLDKVVTDDYPPEEYIKEQAKEISEDEVRIDLAKRSYSFLAMFALIGPLTFLFAGGLLSKLLNNISDDEIFQRISYLVGGWLISPYEGK